MLLSLIFCGCSDSLSIKYPDNPKKFETYDYNNPNNKDDSYRAFDFNNRTYIVYSSLEKSISSKDVGTCLGCIVQDGKEQDVWVVKLKFFKNDDYLMIYYPDSHMQKPEFYRAIDTKGKNIETPAYIASSQYEFWK